ncbi:HNH endonuclease [Bacillus sp. JJ1532]|uniref:HNH endonuclease n=1 Tax=Bacillus sp. JJ1532 TaxID=3122958 RepID=UPI002FFE798E
MKERIDYKNPGFYTGVVRNHIEIVEKVKVNTLPTMDNVKDYYEVHMFEDNYIGVFNTGRQRYLKPHIKDEKDNYFCYGLRTIGNKSKTTYMHRLVGLAWVDGWDIDKVTDHLDNDKQNCLASNLEWVTGKVNTQRAVKDGLGVGRPRVIKVKKPKLTLLELSQSSSKGRNGLSYEQVESVFEMLKEGYSVSSIAKEFKVSQPCISQIVLGKRWKTHPASNCI